MTPEEKLNSLGLKIWDKVEVETLKWELKEWVIESVSKSIGTLWITVKYQMWSQIVQFEQIKKIIS